MSMSIEECQGTECEECGETTFWHDSTCPRCGYDPEAKHSTPEAVPSGERMSGEQLETELSAVAGFLDGPSWGILAHTARGAAERIKAEIERLRGIEAAAKNIEGLTGLGAASYVDILKAMDALRAALTPTTEDTEKETP